MYTLRTWCLLAVVGALVVVCFERATATVSVADPPEQSQLAVGLHLTQPVEQLEPGLPYYADAVVELSHGCRNPVTVTMQVQPTKVASSVPISVDLAVTDTAARKVEAGTLVSDRPRVPETSMAIQPMSISDPELAGWTGHAAVRRYDTGFSVRFHADWVESRGFRSCYVALPDLAGEDAGATQDLLRTSANLQSVFPALTGTVRVRGAGGGALDPSASIPPPNDLRNQIWTCRRDPKSYKVGTSCGGVAVFNKSNAAGAASAQIFVLGALMGVFLTAFIDLLRHPKPRGREPKQLAS